MMPSAQSASNRWLPACLCALIAASGCSAGPDLRVSNQDAPLASIAEGRQLLDQGRAVEAVSAFRRYLRREGGDLRGLNGLAIAYSELGRQDLAAEMFARALALAPDDPATLNNIGFSALRRADARLARRYLEKARGQSGDLEEIEGNLARLALLEAIERRPASPPTYRQAMQAARQDRSSSIAPDATPSAPSPAALIDFTAVNDPFSRPRAAP
ncbi:MAG: tetratricopeptide repeat protein [Alphaproteobacteria bacterium]|nr:tetratricopeptide repeat protein [Alphaproteobacteria bacterium]